MKSSLQDRVFTEIGDIFKEGKFLKEFIPDFEYRYVQLKMAKSFFEHIAQSNITMIEAGTGVGKSIAYLIPAGLAIRENIIDGAIVSTHTKTLQKQLFNKDIEVVKKILLGVKVELAQGLENYVCLLKVQTEDIFRNEHKRNVIFSFLEKTKDGDLTELSDVPPYEYKYRREECTKENCHFFRDCFVFKRIRDWKEADFIITNHAFLLANARLDFPYLPIKEVLIIDEAHHLIGDACGAFGLDVSLKSLKREIFSLFQEGFVPKDKKYMIEKCYEEVDLLSENLFSFLKDSDRKRLLDTPLKIQLPEHLRSLSDAFIVKGRTKKEERSARVKGLKQRFYEIADKIESILFERPTLRVSWVEKEDDDILLKDVPLDVGSILQEFLYQRFSSILFTSATLQYNRDFSFYKRELGLAQSVNTLSLPSPFPYKERVLVYLERNAPSPLNPSYIEYLARYIPEVLKYSKGKGLVLFTAYKMLKELKELLPSLPYPILVQGSAPRDHLLQEFKENKESVLLATNTFWEGIDVPGEALEVLIIVRLPFHVPDEPYHEAKTEQYESMKVNPFFGYSLPLALLRFKQGFGRLIRKKDDKGVFCVMDSRVVKKNYGRNFLSTLPPAPFTYHLKDIERFYASFRKNSPSV